MSDQKKLITDACQRVLLRIGAIEDIIQGNPTEVERTRASCLIHLVQEDIIRILEANK